MEQARINAATGTMEMEEPLSLCRTQLLNLNQPINQPISLSRLMELLLLRCINPSQTTVVVSQDTTQQLL